MIPLKIQTERLQKLTSDMFITDNPTDIVNLFKNKPKPYRLVYDAMIDSYIICDAYEHIHSDMIKSAIKQYMYEEVSNTIENLLDIDVKRMPDTYIDIGANWGIDFDEDSDFEVPDNLDYDDTKIYPWIYCFIFMPIDSDYMSIGYDGYNHEYNYSFGTVFTRDFELGDVSELQNTLKRMDK